ncbi:MAG: SCO family protein [Oleiphilus sp.]|nr:MAG: SCO family protein [Oleiphilus sp.]
MNKKLLTVLLLTSCVVAGILSYLSLTGQSEEEIDLKAAYLPAGDFVLTSGSGATRLSDFRGTPVVLYFGFTYCPDVCPLGLTVIRDALNSDERLASVKTLFVTLDPERDNLSRLNEYLSFFHENLLGLTGELEQIKKVATQYGTYFMKNVPDENGNYSVDHTAYFYVIDGQGKLVRVLDHNTSPEGLASALKKLL